MAAAAPGRPARHARWAGAVALVAALAAWPAGAAGARATGTLRIRTVAGPTCPVEHVPPLAGCAPRPVTGARVRLRPAAGGRARLVSTGRLGWARLSLPAGLWRLAALPVAGTLRRPRPVAVRVRARRVATVRLVYDTGIR